MPKGIPGSKKGTRRKRPYHRRELQPTSVVNLPISVQRDARGDLQPVKAITREGAIRIATAKLLMRQANELLQSIQG